MRKGHNAKEQGIRNTFRPQRGADKSVYSIRDSKGNETVAMEIENKLEWIENDNGTKEPKTTYHKTREVDSNGHPIKGMSKVGFCDKGCLAVVETLFQCHRCRKQFCEVHSFKLHKESDISYCHKCLCVVTGRVHQILWAIYSVAKSCVVSVTALDTENGKKDEQRPEENHVPRDTHPEGGGQVWVDPRSGIYRDRWRN